MYEVLFTNSDFKNLVSLIDGDIILIGFIKTALFWIFVQKIIFKRKNDLLTLYGLQCHYQLYSDITTQLSKMERDIF